MKQLVLIDERGKKRIIPLTGGMVKVGSTGVLDTSKIDEGIIGKVISVGETKFLLLEPNLGDRMEALNRRAQIVLPKDAALIVFYCDVKSGSVVVEGGTGSGALTIALSNFVSPGGRVISYEIRDDFLRIAEENLRRAGMLDLCSLRKGDVTKGIAEKNVDAIVLDIPNPWDAIEGAYDALKPGGCIASYVPTANQVERTVRMLRRFAFIEIRTIETLQREIVVGDMGTRPSFEMLGHTGYLTFGRKVCVKLK